MGSRTSTYLISDFIDLQRCLLAHVEREQRILLGEGRGGVGLMPTSYGEVSRSSPFSLSVSPFLKYKFQAGV